MTETVHVHELATRVLAQRSGRGLRETAREIGISASTLSRIEQGKVPDLDTYVRLCRWLGVPTSQFISNAAPEVGKGTQDVVPRTPDVIAAHLRADKALDPQTAGAMARMVQLAYQAAVSGTLPTSSTD